MASGFYAHSTESLDKTTWQPLEDHLDAVALQAHDFAATFQAEDWGRLAGLLHDAGKATPEFLSRLDGSNVRVDHSTFGARLAQECCGRFGILLSYIIAGHHGGLLDGGEQEGELHFRLKHGKVPPDITLLSEEQFKTELSIPFPLERSYGGFSLAFFTRMVYSCLVDADFLDTERFVSPERSAGRTPGNHEQIPKLKVSLDAHLLKLSEEADPTQVNRLRKEVLAQCRAQAHLPQQFFSLTVPTGGGKTLSSLSFAIDHAVAHDLRRVIYAIPFTSIIEQNAKVFQDILGREQVLEHHCNLDAGEDPDDASHNRKRGLSAENWDAPLIVTTNVQFFESLFSNKPSRCRKLHNIVGSVIVLDEAQAIPTHYLEPCLAALRELVAHYHCSVVLCTATQPALDSPVLRVPLSTIREIVTKPHRLYDQLRRTQVHFIGELTEAELAGRLDCELQVLCIVPTKPQARALFEQLKVRVGTYHLSTNMYPTHRRRVLEAIRGRLQRGERCCLISTSLVEAGVDLDFPVAYRAMAGLDSIAQAAGRCNREGRLNDCGQLGQVYVYKPEKPVRMPWLSRCVARAHETLRSLPESDPLGLEAMRRYFGLLYDVQDLDRKQVLPHLNRITRELYFPFREIAQEFRFIEDETIGVVVPVELEAQNLVTEFDGTDNRRGTLRKLQPYTVALRTREFKALEGAGALEMLGGVVPVLRNLVAYREDVGICIDEGQVWQADDLIC